MINCLVLLTAAALMSLAFTARPRPDLDQARAAFMRAHFAQALHVHDAVARGDLPAAKAYARRLAAHRPEVSFPAGAPIFFTLMQRAGREVDEAQTIEVAAGATATLLTRCGECHRSQHVATRVSRYLQSPALVAATMRAHQEAADLLLIGLVEPSSAAWEAGAGAFGQLRLPREDMPSRQLRARALIGDARLTGLAAEAAQSVRPPDRARVYGRVLSTCARCHEEHDVRLSGPDRSLP